MTGVPWNELKPNTKNAWITEGLQADFENFLPIATKEAKASKSGEVQAIFKTYSLGVSTNRDGIVYGYNKLTLEKRVAEAITNFNDEAERWKQAKRPVELDAFLDYAKVKWSEHLKNELKRGIPGELNEPRFRRAMYRPFDKEWLYYDALLVDRPGGFDKILPGAADNISLCLSSPGNSKPFHALLTDCVPDLHLTGDTQCFPLYTYALDGKIRRDNVTDWALAQFQAQYGPDVTKRDIFHYVYGLLHSPEYRERYKENLKRELPRIPLVGGAGEDEGGEAPTPVAPPIRSNAVFGIPLPPQAGEGLGEDESGTQAAGSPPNLHSSPGTGEGSVRSTGGGGLFRRFVVAGAALAALHVGYEQADEYPLTALVSKDVPFSWRVTKMRLNKDKIAVIVNEALTLAGIPPEAFDYKLGNRSALEWVLDQYQVSTDKRSGIETDPNRADDPEYIVRLVRRVVTVSIETVKIIKSLPPLTPMPAVLP